MEDTIRHSGKEGERMIKHYVEFYYPGIIVADTSVCSIESRDQKIEFREEDVLQ